MKKCLLSILSLFCFIGFSQQQEQSLLWEISGNGLEKSSYLYGTMHVSKKVAFRLDDVFFEALDKSETIALESDPSTWLEHHYEIAMLSPQNFSDSYRDNFYTALFELKHPKELAIRSRIRSDNNMINGYLYRKQSESDNFEEETYLDMFIYQAGKKNNKNIISLEDLDEAQFLTTKAYHNAYKKTVDPWLADLLDKESANLLQENTYRDRNLELLDSIGEASNTRYFREHMLYKRNENMIKVLDSMIVMQSVFAGVGAAHLPGDKGMLNLLRQRGYTVEPLISKQTQKGQDAKQELEDFIAKPELQTYNTSDGFIALKSFTPLREFYYQGQKFSIAPDMTNGAYLSISRFNTFEYLPSDEAISLDRLDNFLFEDIPGDIIKKERIGGRFPGISILNRTKKGDYQKYHIYKTPLELIIIKFAGPKNYVLNYEQDIFNSISFKPASDTLATLQSSYKKYEVTLPEFHIADNLENAGNKLIQGSIGDDFYFIKEAVHHDLNYLEEDRFEAKYIVENFYKNLDIKSSTAKLMASAYSSYEASANKDSLSSEKLFLKSIVKDGSYYLLGYSGSRAEKAADFFNSFKFNTRQYEGFEQSIDTTLHFSVMTITKPMPSYYDSYDSKTDKPYEAQSRSTSYFTKANEQIFVSRRKFHDLQMYAHIDSLWHKIDLRRKISVDEEDRELIQTDAKKTKTGDLYTYSYTLKDSLSAKRVLVKNILKKGVLFKIQTMTDSLSDPSAFISNFYSTFQPLDTLLGEDIFIDKTERFFKALHANDSIVMDTEGVLKFSDKHAPRLIDIISNFEFPENKLDIKTELIEALTELNGPKVLDFLKQLYLDSYSDPDIQVIILKALLDKKDKASNTDFISLLNKDLPLKERDVKSLFYTYDDSLELKRPLFPDLMEFTSIQEYKLPIYRMLSKLKDSSLVKPKVYRNYKKQIITDGKIEVKRSLSSSSSYRKKQRSTLYTYVKLIFPFRKEQMAQEFFDKLLDSEDARALIMYYVMLEQAGEAIPKKLKKKTLENEDNHSLLIEFLYRRNMKPLYLKQYIDQKKFIRSYLLSDIELKPERDSISFEGIKPFETDSGKTGQAYFFILHKKTTYRDSRKLYYAALLDKEDDTNKDLQIEIYYESGYSGDYLDENDKLEERIEAVLEAIKYKTRERLSSRY